MRFRIPQTRDDLLIAYIGLFIGISISIYITIIPIAVDLVLESESKTGVLFAMASFLTFLVALVSPALFKRFSRVTIMKSSLLGACLSLFTIAASQGMIILGAILIYTVFTRLILLSIGLYVRDSVSDNNLGFAEGRYYYLTNIGWLVGPLIAGLSSTLLGHSFTFLLAGTLCFLIFLEFHYHHINSKRIHHVKESHGIRAFFNNFSEFFSEVERLKVIGIAFCLHFFWGFTAVYIPLYIINSGFNELVVGAVTASMTIPLILFEKYFGAQADKKGVRPYLFKGFMITTLFVIAFTLPNPLIVIALMILVGIFLAMLEPLQETYLFKTVKEEDEERFYGVFTAIKPLGEGSGPLVAAGAFAIGGMNAAWLALAIVTGIGALISLTSRK